MITIFNSIIILVRPVFHYFTHIDKNSLKKKKKNDNSPGSKGLILYLKKSSSLSGSTEKLTKKKTIRSNNFTV